MLTASWRWPQAIGCGVAKSGCSFDMLDRALWGHATHPTVGATFFGLSCEVMQIARKQSHLGDAGIDRLNELTI